MASCDPAINDEIVAAEVIDGPETDDIFEDRLARKEQSPVRSSSPSEELGVSKVSGIRIVPFQHKRPHLRRKDPVPHLKDRHADELQGTDEDHVQYRGSSSSYEGMLDHFKSKMAGFPGRKVRDTIDATFESFNYVTRSSLLQRVYRHTQKIHGRANVSYELKRLFIVVLIAFLTASVATAIDQSIRLFSSFKYETLERLYNGAFLEGGYDKPFLFGVSWNTLFAFMAGLCVFISPVAQGSGIPQIKCYLNGVKVPKVVRIKTLICRTVGVVMSVVGGFPVGKEGPMIHSGAAIGAGISQGKSTSLRITSSVFREFRNDRDKRDFVACGAAAGVAAAFGAPIGGVLFAFEEGASHFNPNFIWRLSVCSYLGYVFLQLYRSFAQGIPGELSNGGLISFGRFNDATYSLHSLTLFLAIGVVAALSGSLFNVLNLKLSRFRQRYIGKRWFKLFEVMLTGFFIGASAFMFILVGGQCEKDVDFDVSSGIADEVVYRLNCTYDQQSSAANLWYKAPEDLLKALFHDDINTHNLQTLAVFGPAYWLLSCFTYGLAISNGLFIPCLLIGAVWGRCIGIIFITKIPIAGWGSVGDYALMGACAQLAGTVRLSYSLTVIVLECIGNNTYILPIFMTTLIAKHLGDYYTHGIYHMHVELAGIPILEDEPRMSNAHITAQQVMSDNVVFLPVKAKVADVVTLLRTTTHNAYPVVDTLPKWDEPLVSHGRLRGVMARHDIITMINRRIVSNSEGDELASPRETWAALKEAYPRYPTVSSIKMSLEDQENYMLDFSLCMDLAPITVSPDMLYAPLFNVFRNSGCSHAIVVNFENEVVGVITRKDFLTIQQDRSTANDPSELTHDPLIPAKGEGGVQGAFHELCSELWSACFPPTPGHVKLEEEEEKEGSPGPRGRKRVDNGDLGTEDEPRRSASDADGDGELSVDNSSAQENALNDGHKSDSNGHDAGDGQRNDFLNDEGEALVK